jgi:polar amino acid transport system substrate-binding protein
MTHNRKLAAVAIISAAALALVGCSSSAPSGKGAASAPAASNALTEIQSKGVLTIGSSGNNTPTIFRAASGEYEGIDADWAKIIAKSLGVKVSWQVLDFKGIVPGIQSKQFDVAMSGLRVTEERKQVIDFSDPYAADDAIVVYPKSMSGIKSPENIGGKSVCVVAGSSNGEQPVQRIGTAKEMQSYPGQAEAFAGLKAGRCDVMVTGRTLANDWIKKGEGAGFVVSKKGTDCADFAVGIPKGEPELLKAINSAIAKGIKAGKYDSIAEKWTDDVFPKCDASNS